MPSLPQPAPIPAIHWLGPGVCRRASAAMPQGWRPPSWFVWEAARGVEVAAPKPTIDGVNQGKSTPRRARSAGAVAEDAVAEDAFDRANAGLSSASSAAALAESGATPIISNQRPRMGGRLGAREFGHQRSSSPASGGLGLRVGGEGGPISAVLSKRRPAPHAREPGKVSRGTLGGAAAHCPSTRRRRRTATSGAPSRSSPGSAPTAPTSCAPPPGSRAPRNFG